MTTQIKFGTSGWRAVVADEFTFANVRRAVNGIARYVVSQKPKGAKVIVGRDPRFMQGNLGSRPLKSPRRGHAPRLAPSER